MAGEQSAGITIESLREWVGRTQTQEDTASKTLMAGLRATLDYAEDPWNGELFPLGHWLHFVPDAPQRELAADGHPHKGGFLPPVPLPRRMWAGSDITFNRPIRVGEPLRQVSTIKNIVDKAGKQGPLYFLTVAHEVFASDELALTDTQTIVYREESPVDPDAAANAAASRDERLALEAADVSDWDYSLIVRPTETMLFRYSALTFNAHRIHYDRPYATGVEGYPGLVVHGPLSATYLMESFLRAHPGATPKSFSFSARQPIFDGTPVAYAGRETSAGTVELGAIDPAGKVCLKGTLTY